MARQSLKRHQDRERAHRQRLDALPRGTWKEERLRYTPEVRRFVDGLVARGVSLADVYALQAARFRAMEILFEEAVEEREEAKKENDGKIPNGSTVPGAKTLSAYDHAMTQSLKHMRMVAIAIDPKPQQGEQPVKVPEGYDRAGMTEKVAQRPSDEIMN